MRHSIRLAYLLLAAVTASSCGTMMSDMSPGQAMPHGGHRGHADASAPAPVPGAGTITVNAGDLFFDPEELEVRVGEPVNIELANGGDAFHDLSVDGTDFMLDADPGTTVGGALTFDEPGTYTFRCTVPGHAQAGMTGTITVAG